MVTRLILHALYQSTINLLEVRSHLNASLITHSILKWGECLHLSIWKWNSRGNGRVLLVSPFSSLNITNTTTVKWHMTHGMKLSSDNRHRKLRQRCNSAPLSSFSYIHILQGWCLFWEMNEYTTRVIQQHPLLDHSSRMFLKRCCIPLSGWKQINQPTN